MNFDSMNLNEILDNYIPPEKLNFSRNSKFKSELWILTKKTIQSFLR